MGSLCSAWWPSCYEKNNHTEGGGSQSLQSASCVDASLTASLWPTGPATRAAAPLPRASTAPPHDAGVSPCLRDVGGTQQPSTVIDDLPMKEAQRATLQGLVTRTSCRPRRLAATRWYIAADAQFLGPSCKPLYQVTKDPHAPLLGLCLAVSARAALLIFLDGADCGFLPLLAMDSSAADKNVARVAGIDCLQPTQTVGTGPVTGQPPGTRTAVLPKIPRSNCCKRVPNRPLRPHRGRFGTLLEQLQ